MDSAIVIALLVVGAALLVKPARRLWWRWFLLRDHRKGRPHPKLQALWRGDIEPLRAAVSSSTQDIDRLRLACAELEAGDVEASRRHQQELPADNASAVLGELIRLRSGRSEDGWLADLESAWQAAGSPDLRGHPCLNRDLLRSFDPGDADADLNSTEQMLWAYMTFSFAPGLLGRSLPTQLKRWAITHATSSTNVAELLVVASVLAGSKSVKAKGQYHRVVAHLVELLPDNTLIMLTRLSLRHRSVQFVHDDLDELDAILATPEVSWSAIDETHRRFEEVAARRGSGSLQLLAHSAAQYAQLVPDIENLVARFCNTSSELSEAVSRRFVELGRRLRQDRFAMNAIVGLGMLRQATKVLKSTALADEVTAGVAECRLLVALDEHLALQPLAWPLRSLVDEVIEAEKTDRHQWCRNPRSSTRSCHQTTCDYIAWRHRGAAVVTRAVSSQRPGHCDDRGVARCRRQAVQRHS